MELPPDILRIIIDILPMPDKRNLIRCTTQLNKFQYQMPSYVKQFVAQMDPELRNQVKNMTLREYYLLEYLHYGYVSNVPTHYIGDGRYICTELRNYIGEKNYTELINLLIECNECNRIDFIRGLVKGQHLETLKVIYKNCYSISHDVARYGTIEMLEWLRTQDCEWDSKICISAASSGNMETLQWLSNHNYEIYSGASYAAEHGHLNVLKWLYDNDYLFDEDICTCAALGGSIEMMQWLMDHNYTCDDETCLNAARGGNLEMLPRGAR